MQGCLEITRNGTPGKGITEINHDSISKEDYKRKESWLEREREKKFENPHL